MAVEGHNLEPQLLQMIEEYVDWKSGEVIGARGRGHFFVKKNFGKPIHCHHCCDLFWGILSQGYICETSLCFSPVKLVIRPSNAFAAAFIVCLQFSEYGKDDLNPNPTYQ
ncbi:conserved hypothetical protein [Trichinella spiralis]|uniref:hypothetical protein n=1 Tax=Trichinella spiralis TaxID=6334 RepID=UPI0001EFCFEA|nr:conserved hypothetical protein [Trichinella spiralis]